VLVYPNPVVGNTGIINFRIDSSQVPDSVRVKIYTTAFRLIKDITFTTNLSYECIIRVPLFKTGNIASGTYIYTVILRSSQAGEAKSKLGVFIVLR
jgi:hypothetical protein